MVDLLHAMAFMMLLLVGWVIWNNKPLTIDQSVLPVLRYFSDSKRNGVLANGRQKFLTNMRIGKKFGEAKL